MANGGETCTLRLGALLVVLGAVALVAGCGGDSDDPVTGGNATAASTTAAAGEDSETGAGVRCADFDIAPPLDESELVGEWSYYRSTLYEDGEDYNADVRGSLVIGGDGRWDGQRAIEAGDGQGGSFYYPTAYGPGDWSFDGRSVTLEYDDGSDGDTFTGVRVSLQENPEDGQQIRAMTLETADATGCTVYLLFAQVT